MSPKVDIRKHANSNLLPIVDINFFTTSRHYLFSLLFSYYFFPLKIIRNLWEDTFRPCKYPVSYKKVLLALITINDSCLNQSSLWWLQNDIFPSLAIHSHLEAVSWHPTIGKALLLLPLSIYLSICLFIYDHYILMNSYFVVQIA